MDPGRLRSREFILGLVTWIQVGLGVGSLSKGWLDGPK